MLGRLLVGGPGDGYHHVGTPQPTLRYAHVTISGADFVSVDVAQYAVPTERIVEYHRCVFSVPWPTRWVPWTHEHELVPGCVEVEVWCTRERRRLIEVALAQFLRADARARAHVKAERVLRTHYWDGPFDSPIDDEGDRRRTAQNLAEHTADTRHFLRERRKWKWQVERLMLPRRAVIQGAGVRLPLRPFPRSVYLIEAAGWVPPEVAEKWHQEYLSRFGMAMA